MKVKCRKQWAGIILVYKMYMYKRQIETYLQKFKTDESLIAFWKLSHIQHIYKIQRQVVP